MKSELVRRSILFVPANRLDFAEKAWTRNADAIYLDLEDAIAPEEKANARGYLEKDVKLVSKGGADVIIRCNSEWELLQDDLRAAVMSGIWGVALTKLETEEDVARADALITALEKEKELPAGSINITAFIETAKGFFNAKEILGASPRIKSSTFGTEDFIKDIGMVFSDSKMLYYPKLQMMLMAKLYGLHCTGMMGRNTSFRDLEGLERLAREAYEYGFDGCACIHPSQVEIMNRAYSPKPEDVEEAREIIRVLEESVAQGKGAVKLNGRMIDRPIQERAKDLIEKVNRIEKKEAYKKMCMEEARKNMNQ